MQLDSSSFAADPELIRALGERSTPISCETDRVLFRQGDPPVGLYILRQGEAALSMITPAGQPILSGHATAGSLLGLPGLVGNQPYSLTASVRAGSQVSFVSRDDFAALMLSDPSLSFKILRILAAEVHTARRALY